MIKQALYLAQDLLCLAVVCVHSLCCGVLTDLPCQVQEASGVDDLVKAIWTWPASLGWVGPQDVHILHRQWICSGSSLCEQNITMERCVLTDPPNQVNS